MCGVVHERLLDIAIREFAASGLDGASTRAIAAAAGTAMSAITYHYGGKEGLYLAAADYISGQMEDFAAEYGTDSIIAANDSERASEVVKLILGHMVDRLANHENESWSLFIVREQMSPTEAFERIYAGLMGRMMEVLVELVRVATGGVDRQTASIAVLTLFGQVVVLRAARATCARLVGGDCADPEFVGQFHQRIARNIEAVLQALTIEHREHA